MKHLIMLVVTLSMILFSIPASAEIPPYMQFQGKATDVQDAPLNGTYKLMFRIYDAEVSGNIIWSELHNTVTIENGVFSVLLGGTNPLNIPFDRPYWISVEINTTDGTGEMPRQMITSAGYAYYAHRAERAGVADTVANASELSNIVQVVNTIVTSPVIGATTIPWDNTIPQNTEGTEVVTLAITPTSATNKLLIEVVAVVCARTTSDQVTVALFQDSTANALAAVSNGSYGTPKAQATPLTYYMTAGTTSLTTFKVRAGGQNGGVYFNANNAGTQLYNGVCVSSITITEIQP